MARTYIISADGTQFEATTVAQARRRRTAFRSMKALTIIAAIPFLIAAFVGIGMAATGNAPADINASSAASSTPTLPKPLPKAMKACKGVDNRYQGYCIGLALRPAYTVINRDGSKAYTPNGFALVKECRTEYRGKALAHCFTQPIN